MPEVVVSRQKKKKWVNALEYALAVNHEQDLHSVLGQTLQKIQKASGFEAVGLRLRDGDDCPYFEHNGFSEEFIKEENSLCARVNAGTIVRDGQGQAVLECTCGLVLSGKTPSHMACFTPGGSFWTNRSTELLSLPAADDPRLNPRNRCIHTNYESVGLFPIRVGENIIGLLQLNDSRPGRFTPELVGCYESLALSIGLAVHRAQAEQALKQTQQSLEQERKVLQGINQLFREALGCQTEAELGCIGLRISEGVTGSKFGFLAELNSTTGLLDTIAVSDPGWVACKMSGRTRPTKLLPVSMKIHGIYGRVVQDGKGFFTNQPAAHPDSIGTPAGHPPLTCFLGVPLVHHGKTIGIIGVGNREGGYRPVDLQALESISPAVVQVLMRHRAEQRGRESLDRMNRSQEIAHLGSWELDLVKNQLSWSDEVYRIFGLKPQEFDATYEAFLDAVHPDDRAKVDAAYSGSVRDGRDSYEIEHRVVWKDTGEVRIVHERCEHSRDESGRIIRSVGMVHDITERKRAEEALRRSEDRLRRLVEVSSQMVWVTNGQGEAIEDSPSWRAFTGRPYEQWKGWNWLDAIHPDDRDELAQLWLAAISRRSVFQAEFRMLHRSGEYRHVVTRAVPILNADGTVREWIGMNTDITESTRAKRALQAAEYRFRRLVDSNIVGVVVANQERVTEANDLFLQMIGRSREELEQGAIHWRTITPPQWASADEKGLAELVRFGACTPYEKEYLRKDGSRVPILIGASLLNRSPLSWICFVLDLTERKQMIEVITQAKEDLRRHADSLEKIVEERTARLQEVVSEMEHFSYTLSHDLRAPLRAIRGFADIMSESGCAQCPSTSSKEFLQRILAGAERMDLMMGDALEYNRAVRNLLQLEPVDAGALLRGMVQTHPNLQPLFADIRLEGEFPLVQGNETALTQCFSNLLSNAIKYMAPGVKPQIRIWAQVREQKYVRLWFEDNGIGIAKEHQAKLFQMFQRVSKAYEGTGIGLALVKKNAERMGGGVGVESELGKGSRFWIELKLA